MRLYAQREGFIEAIFDFGQLYLQAMSLYVLGVACALAAPAFFAAGNVFDSYLSNAIFKRLTVLIWITSAFYVVCLPVAWLFEPAHLLPAPLLLIAFLVAVTEILYQFPYYWALRRADTSIVVSLFSLGKIFVPVFAYLLVGEHLAPLQYSGFFLIISCTVALSMDMKQFRFNIAFFHMAVVSLLLAGQTALFKYAFTLDGGLSSVFSAAMIMEFLLMSLAFINRDNRRDFKFVLRSLRRVSLPLLGMELSSFVGSMISMFALSLIPATVSSGLSSVQALFALLYAELFERQRRKYFHESLSKKRVHRKVALFALIILGTLLVAAG